MGKYYLNPNYALAKFKGILSIALSFSWGLFE